MTLASRLAAHCFTITKAECNPDIPPCHLQVERVEMGAEQSLVYHHFLDRSNIRGNHAFKRAAKQIGYLRDICAAPHSASVKLNGPICHSNHTPKTRRIIELINTEPHQQFVVVSARIEQTTEIQRWLAASGISFARIDSTTKDHAGQAADFKSGAKHVMLMGAKCAAAYSFPQCRRLIIASLEWSPGILDQTIGRIYRVNSTQTCQVWILLHAGTIEEVQLETNRRKDQLIKQLLRGTPIDIPQTTPEDLLRASIAIAKRVPEVYT
jgi:SNF2 family DNA or RNA helicase